MSYDSNTMINSLILPSKSWDIGKLKNLFLPYEVEVIKCVPPPVVAQIQDIESLKKRKLLGQNWILGGPKNHH